MYGSEKYRAQDLKSDEAKVDTKGRNLAWLTQVPL